MGQGRRTGDSLRLMRRLAICFFVAAGALLAQPPKAELLWPKGAPGALGTTPEDQPSLAPFVLPKGSGAGTAVIVCPGGGYQHLSMDKEGYQVAQWLNSIGVSAFVLQYRLGPRYHHPSELQDAQRAIRLVRSRAAEYGLQADRIGIMGFSAGGHLAAESAANFEAGIDSATEAIDRASSRPDFLVLWFRVISIGTFAHIGSRWNL